MRIADRKHSGTLSRAYYLQPGQYIDNAGNRAAVDGQGDDEGVLGKKDYRQLTTPPQARWE